MSTHGGFERVYFPGELETMEQVKPKKTGIPGHEAGLKACFQSLRDHNLMIEERLLVGMRSLFVNSIVKH